MCSFVNASFWIIHLCLSPLLCFLLQLWSSDVGDPANQKFWKQLSFRTLYFSLRIYAHCGCSSVQRRAHIQKIERFRYPMFLKTPLKTKERKQNYSFSDNGDQSSLDCSVPLSQPQQNTCLGRVWTGICMEMWRQMHSW